MITGKSTAVTGAVNRLISDKLGEELSAFDFMSPAQIADVRARTRTLDVSAPMQAFFDALPGRRGHMPAGDYLCNTALIARQGMTVLGHGIAATVLVTTQNIEQVVNDPAGSFSVLFRDIQVKSEFPVQDVAGPSTTATVSTGSSTIVVASTAGLTKGIRIVGAGIPANSYIRFINGLNVGIGTSTGAYVNATASATNVAITTFYRQGSTKFQFHIKNAGKWLLDNVMFYTAFSDNDYSPLNAAGCWFDRTDAGAASYVNYR